ncbi:winged helix-turn-helix domain-containing protein [Halohasta litorea]|uniref:ArsR family transcriptional regulator n=1 Tax=Halohasta litorea TaxID=869891 RepID=A0ABD6D7H9_9EURY|nr:winged helix-turn-helix domain-containing protein [Halohasta litorea]
MTSDPADADDDEFDETDVDEEFDDESDGPRAELQKTKARLEEEADRAVSEFDQGIVDLLAWILDTETRARIFVYLRQHPHSTSDEVADGTGLYPSTVREALAELHEEDTVHREKRESSGAGNNPYEYEAIAPSELVRGVVGEVQRELNTVFNLDRRLGETDDEEGGPVTISVDGDDEDEAETEASEAVDIEVEDASADSEDDDVDKSGDKQE